MPPQRRALHASARPQVTATRRMNLLVTNTRATQAYAIIRALRPHAEKIVVTMYATRLRANRKELRRPGI